MIPFYDSNEEIWNDTDITELQNRIETDRTERRLEFLHTESAIQSLREEISYLRSKLDCPRPSLLNCPDGQSIADTTALFQIPSHHVEPMTEISRIIATWFQRVECDDDTDVVQIVFFWIAKCPQSSVTDDFYVAVWAHLMYLASLPSIRWYDIQQFGMAEAQKKCQGSRRCKWIFSRKSLGKAPSRVIRQIHGLEQCRVDRHITDGHRVFLWTCALQGGRFASSRALGILHEWIQCRRAVNVVDNTICDLLCSMPDNERFWRVITLLHQSNQWRAMFSEEHKIKLRDRLSHSRLKQSTLVHVVSNALSQ